MKIIPIVLAAMALCGCDLAQEDKDSSIVARPFPNGYVSRFEDGDNTCYVFTHGGSGAGISCVKRSK